MDWLLYGTNLLKALYTTCLIHPFIQALLSMSVVSIYHSLSIGEQRGVSVLPINSIPYSFSDH